MSELFLIFFYAYILYRNFFIVIYFGGISFLFFYLFFISNGIFGCMAIM